MPHVVFLRAANVGGNNVFRPAKLVAGLAHLGAVNIGAAGTFVIREKASAAAIRREILSRLQFVPDLAVRPASDVLRFVDGHPFRGVEFSKDLRGWVAVLTGKPKSQATLPLVVPPGNAWSVRFERLDGAFAVGLWQRRSGGFVFPSNVVDRALGVSSTTRWWETFERIAAVIRR